VQLREEGSWQCIRHTKNRQRCIGGVQPRLIILYKSEPLCHARCLHTMEWTGGGERGGREAFGHAGMLNSKRWMATSSVHDGNFKKKVSHSYPNEYQQGKRRKIFLCYSHLWCSLVCVKPEGLQLMSAKDRTNSSARRIGKVRCRITCLLYTVKHCILCNSQHWND
jgi:hypothetical protein